MCVFVRCECLCVSVFVLFVWADWFVLFIRSFVCVVSSLVFGVWCGVEA